MEKLCLRQAIIVEGKYDKIRLDALVEGVILTTDGFRIFKDREMRAFIRKLAHAQGIVVLTDADAAGFAIRAHVAQAAQGGEVIHAYIPDVWGKERRKNRPSAENKVGVEGMDTQELLRTFERAGIIPSKQPTIPEEEQITRQDFYDLGLNGGPHSRWLRRELCRKLALPQRLSQNSLLPVLQGMLTCQELVTTLESLETSPPHHFNP